jgi:hypothetical protein
MRTINLNPLPISADIFHNRYLPGQFIKRYVLLRHQGTPDTTLYFRRSQ